MCSSQNPAAADINPPTGDSLAVLDCHLPREVSLGETCVVTAFLLDGVTNRQPQDMSLGEHTMPSLLSDSGRSLEEELRFSRSLTTFAGSPPTTLFLRVCVFSLTPQDSLGNKDLSRCLSSGKEGIVSLFS